MKLQCHFFSHNLSRIYGIEAAILLRLIADQIQKQPLRKGESPHYLATLPELRQQLPYISKQTIGRELDKLRTLEVIHIAVADTKKQPPISSISLSRDISIAAHRGSIRLDVEVAIKLGIPAGILIEELRYRVTNNLCQERDRFVNAFAHQLSKVLPITHQEFDDAFERLKAAQLVIPHPKVKYSCRLPETDRLIVKLRREGKGKPFGQEVPTFAPVTAASLSLPRLSEKNRL